MPCYSVRIAQPGEYKIKASIDLGKGKLLTAETKFELPKTKRALCDIGETKSD